MDDYAVDTIERNDQSFIYLLDQENRIPRTLRLYPTLIRLCRAHRAEGVYALSIVKKMKDLCAAFDLFADWNQAQGRLEIACLADDAGKTHSDRSVARNVGYRRL